MGIHNRLCTHWKCPVCGTQQIGGIYFRYGPCTGDDAELGDDVNWNKKGVIYDKRPDGGTAIVEGWTQCGNTWKMKWLRNIGAIDEQGRGTGAVAPGINWPPEGHSLPTIEERRKIGCPDLLIAQIVIINDRIERLQWPTDEKVLFGDRY